MKYWVMLNGVRLGPMTLDEVRALPLQGSTPVWRSGLPEWTTASALPELAGMGCCDSDTPPGYQPQPVYPAYNSGASSGYNGGEEVRPPMPDTYLVWAIVVTLCCCLVGGVVALIYSSKVTSLYNQGDYAGAQKASSTALTWIIVSAVIGVVSTPILIMSQIAAGVMESLI